MGADYCTSRAKRDLLARKPRASSRHRRENHGHSRLERVFARRLDNSHRTMHRRRLPCKNYKYMNHLLAMRFRRPSLRRIVTSVAARSVPCYHPLPSKKGSSSCTGPSARHRRRLLAFALSRAPVRRLTSVGPASPNRLATYGRLAIYAASCSSWPAFPAAPPCVATRWPPTSPPAAT